MLESVNSLLTSAIPSWIAGSDGHRSQSFCGRSSDSDGAPHRDGLRQAEHRRDNDLRLRLRAISASSSARRGAPISHW